jgi:hypothetical protein
MLLASSAKHPKYGSGPSSVRCSRSRRRPGSHAQSIVEFSLVLPFLFFLVAGVYTVWTALHQEIGLTNAARAGVIEAVSDPTTGFNYYFTHSGTRPPSSTEMCFALGLAAQGVAAEEGIPTSSVSLNDPSHWCHGPPQLCNSTTNPCVTIAWSTLHTTGGQAYYEANVTINQNITPGLPIISGVHVTANAAEVTG